jgi:hypothetical protein
MKKTIIAIALLLTIILSTTTYAFHPFYGMHDSDDNFITTSSRLTGLSTTGLTDNTTENSQKKRIASLNMFVADNLNNLAIGIAKGSGEYVEALAELKQISRDNKKQFFASLKTNFDVIFPSTEIDNKYVVSEINKIAKKSDGIESL